MWWEDAVVYQIYPLGLCGAPAQNSGGEARPRIRQLLGWVQHIKSLGTGAVLFNPVWESDAHGYDTRDYFALDARLGTNEDFAAVCKAIHGAGMKVMLDGVFNHVGRGFWAFRDVQQKKRQSPYQDWFCIDFGGNSNYGDGFWYEGWEGHYELVKLNLQNPDVVRHQFDAIREWVRLFDIDGLRLDVAYCLPPEYLRALRAFTNSLKPGFVLLGEALHGDYNRWMNDEMCHSVTNYECYKGLYSSFNTMNLFEIGYSLNRQFGPEPWTLYRGKHLVNFADNHDVTRVASILTDKNQLEPLYGVLFAMPGIPCLYYGSEWGAEGEKCRGDGDLRPCFERPAENALTEWIAKLAAVKRESRALNFGDYRNVTIQNKNLLFERACPEETVLVAVNAENAPCSIDARGSFTAQDLLTGETVAVNGRVELPPYGVRYLKLV